MIAVEHRVSQDCVVAQHAFLNGAAVERNLFVERINVQTLCVTQQYVEQGQDIVTGGAFVQRNADRIVNVAAQVDLCCLGARQHGRFVCHLDAQGVEVVLMTQSETFLLQTAGQDIGQTVDAAGNAFQASRAVEYRV